MRHVNNLKIIEFMRMDNCKRVLRTVAQLINNLPVLVCKYVTSIVFHFLGSISIVYLCTCQVLPLDVQS